MGNENGSNMEEFYRRKKKEAREQMADLYENPVEDSWRGMHDAHAFVVKRGTANDIASADMILASWVHWNCELETLMEMNKGNSK